MLDFTRNTTTFAPPARSISGQTVAKTSWTPQERAERATDWMQNRIHLARPTKLQAATVFGASTSLITAKIRKRKNRGCSALAAPAALDALWTALDPAERADFITRNQAVIWKIIDRLTA